MAPSCPHLRPRLSDVFVPPVAASDAWRSLGAPFWRSLGADAGVDALGPRERLAR